MPSNHQCGADVGLYYIKTFVDNNKNKKFTIGAKKLQVIKNSNEPGPANYDVSSKTGINPQGKFIQAKYPRVKNLDFGKGKKVSVFIKKTEQTPDPGCYTDGIEAANKTIRDKMPSLRYNRSTMKPRLITSEIDDRVPGPGQYPYQSEFGVSYLRMS